MATGCGGGGDGGSVAYMMSEMDYFEWLIYSLLQKPKQPQPDFELRYSFSRFLVGVTT